MANKIKSVWFNVDDPDQVKMLEHAKTRSSFSGYVKRLIQRDMEGGYGYMEKGGLIMEKIIKKDIIKGHECTGIVTEDRTWFIAIIIMMVDEIPRVYTRTGGSFQEAEKYILDTWRDLERV